ncbi:hypothetical protein [Panacagrimonas sp.]|uniref:hypothetical protein n=1 Tax=Panacagrimonas sp. TaxID=2480088 RepID=UPI003B51F75D
MRESSRTDLGVDPVQLGMTRLAIPKRPYVLRQLCTVVGAGAQCARDLPHDLHDLTRAAVEGDNPRDGGLVVRVINRFARRSPGRESAKADRRLASR